MIQELVLALSMMCPAVPAKELKQDAQVLVSAAVRYNLPPTVLAAIMVRESTCRRDVANKRTGAGGLMGILKRIPGETYVENIHMGARLLAEYLGRCKEVEMALSAFNRGPNQGKNCRPTSYSDQVLSFEKEIILNTIP
jgi:soluble lytic murein transglycosylase-like protein